MKTNLDQSRSRAGRSNSLALHKTLLLLLLVSFWLPAVRTHAAQITFAPNSLNVTAIPGETVLVPVSVSLTDTSSRSAYANFTLAYFDGTLDHSWMNGQAYVSLNSWYKTRQVILQVTPPANAKGGKYVGILKTFWLTTNESIEPVELTVNVDVVPPLGCNQVPIFSDIQATDESVDVRNNKRVTIGLSGSVSAPEECAIDRVWYELSDEYGEQDRQGAVTINVDGSFVVSVPMMASRQGNDKDGRLYSVQLKAVDEAGEGESGVVNITVAHDNRKE